MKSSYHLLYYIGQKNKLFKVKYIFYWLFTAFTTSTSIFLIIFYSLRDSIINRDGHNVDMWFLSITMYTAIIIVVDMKLLLNTNHVTIFVVLSIFVLSLGVYFGYSWGADAIFKFKIYKTLFALISSPVFYLVLGLIIGFFIIVEVLIFVMEREFNTPLYLLFYGLLKNQNRFV